jgi:hypothetical protein
MKLDIFCCGREVPDEKEIEVLKAHKQVGEEMGQCARSLESSDELLAMEGRRAVRQSRGQQSWPRGSGDGQSAVSEIVVRVRKSAGAGRL